MNPTTILHKVITQAQNFDTCITGKLYFDDVDDLRTMIIRAKDLKAEVIRLINALEEAEEELDKEEAEEDD